MNESRLKAVLALQGLPGDAVLEVELPPEGQDFNIGELLEYIFPADDTDRRLIEESLDVAVNPDLPEIYEHFLRVIDQFRSGLCQLQILDSVAEEVLLTGTAGQHCLAQPCSAQTDDAELFLAICPIYDALGYGEAKGYLAGEPDPVLWMHVCLALYFVDKHEARLPLLEELREDDPLKHAIEGLIEGQMIDLWPDAVTAEISAEGRRFIGELLAETEVYIDLYDHYKDVVWDEDEEQAIFASGQGDDLRVESFLLDGLDPLRVVFLLRLYDGTLDEFADTWDEQVTDRKWLNWILEPVVNRTTVNLHILKQIVEQGLALVEEAAEEQQEQQRRARLIRRLNSSLS